MIFLERRFSGFLTTTLLKNHLSLGDIFGCGECIVSVRQSKEGRGPTALVSSLISIRIVIFPFEHRPCIVVEIAHFRRLFARQKTVDKLEVQDQRKQQKTNDRGQRLAELRSAQQNGAAIAPSGAWNGPVVGGTNNGLGLGFTNDHFNVSVI